MFLNPSSGPARLPVMQSGMSMIEVLVTIVILAFGLLGLAAFQMRIQNAELESTQRAQALILLEDMAARVQASGSQATEYVATVLGTGVEVCTGDSGTSAGDKCEWSEWLKGASASTLRSGNLVGGRGCITQIQAPDSTAGLCRPGTYLVEVAWQGVMPTAAPASACASGLYGDDRERRVVSTRVTIGLLGCS